MDPIFRKKSPILEFFSRETYLPVDKSVKIDKVKDVLPYWKIRRISRVIGERRDLSWM